MSGSSPASRSFRPGSSPRRAPTPTGSSRRTGGAGARRGCGPRARRASGCLTGSIQERFPSGACPRRSPAGKPRSPKAFARFDIAAETDDLAEDSSSRLGAYLHFGCVSPLARGLVRGSRGFLRKLAWRDFFAQLLAAEPQLANEDMRPRREWRDDPDDLEPARRPGRPVSRSSTRACASCSPRASCRTACGW